MRPFKTTPDEEGIETVLDARLCRKHLSPFKTTPDEEGIETLRLDSASEEGAKPFKTTPDEEGIETSAPSTNSGVAPGSLSKPPLTKKGLRQPSCAVPESRGSVVFQNHP